MAPQNSTHLHLDLDSKMAVIAKIQTQKNALGLIAWCNQIIQLKDKIFTYGLKGQANVLVNCRSGLSELFKSNIINLAGRKSRQLSHMGNSFWQP